MADSRLPGSNTVPPFCLKFDAFEISIQICIDFRKMQID